MFAPLVVFSEFSPGVGSSSPEALVQRAAALGYPALALTDVENLRGQVRFHHAARAWGVRAVTGVTLRERGKTLVVLARDEAGYEALCRCVTWRQLHEWDEPWAGLEPEHPGLLYLTDDDAWLAQRTALGATWWLRRAGALAHASVRAAACPEVVMASPEEAGVHALSVAIANNARLRDPEAVGAMPSPAELRAQFDASALGETLRITERCVLDLTGRGRAFPQLPDAFATLSALVWAAARLKPPDERRDRRLAEELAVIDRLGFATYFFLVAEVVDAAQELGITVAARGSVVSSLVGHLLRFSPVDPLREGLLFERFLHGARTAPPDIDLDVPSERRDELMGWTLRHLGRERAARISTHVTLQRKTAWRLGLAACGVDAKTIDAVAASMPSDPDWPEPPRLRGALVHLTPTLEALVDRFHHVSVHPGGLVVTPERLSAFTPLERAGGDDVVTQLDATALASLGLLKLDLLGSRALSIIDEARRLSARDGTEASPDDERTLAALRAGDTLGCAQVETPAVRTTLQALPLRSRGELTAALAVVRPGPGSGRARAAFLERVQAPSRVVEGLFAETAGVPLYDEDLIRLIAATTGLGFDEADALRTRVIHGDVEEARQRFDELALATGQGREAREHAWRTLQRFSAYSFSKAHAASAAEQAWAAVELKHREPAAFACAVLNHYGGAYPLRTLVADFQRHGVPVLRPSVNASQVPCTVEGEAVRLGLARLKHLRGRTVLRLLEARPFSSLTDLLAEVRPSKAELGSLVMSGACDGLEPLVEEAYPLLHEDVLDRLASGRSLAGLAVRRAVGAKGALWRGLQRVKHELALLEVHVSAHPLALLRSEAERVGCVTVAALEDRVDGRARFAGLVAASRRHRLADGRWMQFVTFEDETGLVEATLEPAVLSALGDPVTSPGPWLLEGRVMREHRALKVALFQARPFHQRAAQPA